MDRPELVIGDHLQTPYGIARVVDFDHPRNGIVTTHGSWGWDEVEHLPAPETDDLTQVEKWLDLAARIVPKMRVESRTLTCPCDCAHCYNVEQFRRPRYDSDEVEAFMCYHFRHNDTCRCVEEQCACL